MKARVTTPNLLEVVLCDPLGREDVLENWYELSKDALDPNPFFDPSFLRPYLREMAQNKIKICVVREIEGKRWLVAAPIGARRIGVSLQVRSIWTSEYAPLGTPLVHPNASVEAMRLFLDKAAGWFGTFVIPYCPLKSKTTDLVRSAFPDRVQFFMQGMRACHSAGKQGEKQLAEALTGKRRKEMNRVLKRLGDVGDVQFKTVHGKDVIQEFQSFLDLESRGWKGRNGTALLSFPASSAFARETITQKSALNSVCIEQLWVSDVLVAAMVLFVERGHVYAWKTAFDEAYSRYSPGAQIALHTFRQNLVRQGFESADSLAVPGHSMIEPLWRGRLEIGTLLYTNGLLAGAKRQLVKLDVASLQILKSAGKKLIKGSLNARFA